MSISIPFEELVAAASGNDDVRYDCLIIGSGYGGAAAAHTFSQRRKPSGEKLKVAVLERGKEYLPGSFPTGLGEALSAFKRPGANNWSAAHDGLFDARNSDTHWILGGNGVGGGSLINAGVILPPDAKTLSDDRWPEQARSVARQPPSRCANRFYCQYSKTSKSRN